MLPPNREIPITGNRWLTTPAPDGPMPSSGLYGYCMHAPSPAVCVWVWLKNKTLPPILPLTTQRLSPFITVTVPFDLSTYPEMSAPEGSRFYVETEKPGLPTFPIRLTTHSEPWSSTNYGSSPENRNPRRTDWQIQLRNLAEAEKLRRQPAGLGHLEARVGKRNYLGPSIDQGRFTHYCLLALKYLHLHYKTGIFLKIRTKPH